MALVCFLHFNLHLVGLRRMRLCLILRSGLCPKNPQGTLSLDPASPLTPGLSLRLSVRYARCWVYNSGRLCPFLIPHSSFLIPHSSLLTPHSSFLISTSFLHNTNTPITFGTAISPLKISDTPHTSSMLHIVPMHPQAIAMIL